MFRNQTKIIKLIFEDNGSRVVLCIPKDNNYFDEIELNKDNNLSKYKIGSIYTPIQNVQLENSQEGGFVDILLLVLTIIIYGLFSYMQARTYVASTTEKM